MNDRPVTRQLARRLAPQLPQGYVTRHRGEITATSAGPPATVSVKIDGQTTALSGIRYLASYSPVVGDIVEILIDDTDVLILGDLA